MLIADLDHVYLAVQIQIRTGHGESRAPLSGASLRGDALETLCLGIICLGDSRVQLVGARGVVALELIVDFRRGLQLFLQAVGPDQG